VEQYRALEQLWSHNIWSAFRLGVRKHPPTSHGITTNWSDELISENLSYNDDENGSDYPEEELSDGVEESEDEDFELEIIDSVPRTTKSSATEATEQPHEV
jgi:hypothetical protein